MSPGGPSYVSRMTSTGAETTIASLNEVPGLQIGVGEELNIRLQAFGTGPTTLRMRAWKAVATEPTTWQISTTDNTAGLGAAGGVGVIGYLSSSATNAPVTLTVDRLRVTAVP